jgi:DNA-3-methyladenine glycosylase I
MPSRTFAELLIDCEEDRVLRAVLVGMLREIGSLDAYLWSFVGGQPLVGRFKGLGDIPVETAESKAMSKDLKGNGFRFVGPTVCYAFMQACGLVNGHVASCFRFREIVDSYA